MDESGDLGFTKKASNYCVIACVEVSLTHFKEPIKRFKDT
ncbi:MAG: hypothetical protein ACLFVX_05175 [Archaeoglobaceae archaeon]